MAALKLTLAGLSPEISSPHVVIGTADISCAGSRALLSVLLATPPNQLYNHRGSLHRFSPHSAYRKRGHIDLVDKPALAHAHSSVHLHPVEVANVLDAQGKPLVSSLDFL